MNQGKKSGMPCPPPGCGRLAAFALAAACGAAAALPAAAQRAPETPIALPAAGRDRGLENCAYALGRLFAPPRIHMPRQDGPGNLPEQEWLRGLSPSAAPSLLEETAQAGEGCLTIGAEIAVVNRGLGPGIGLGTLPGMAGSEPLFVSHGGRLWGGEARFGMNYAGESAAFGWTGFHSWAEGSATASEPTGGAPVAYTFGQDAFGSTGLFLGATGADSRSEIAYSHYGVSADLMMSDIAALRHLYGADTRPEGDGFSRWAVGVAGLWSHSTLEHTGWFRSATFPDIRADVDRTLTSDAFGLGPKVTLTRSLGDSWALALGADLQLVWRDSTLRSREAVECGPCGSLPARFDVDVIDEKSGFDWAGGLDASLSYRHSPGFALTFGASVDVGGRDTIRVRANPSEPATGIRRETAVDWSFFAGAMLRF